MEVKNVNEIGKEIAKRREAMGLSQAELAPKLLTSTSMLGQIEVGMKMPTVAIIKLAAELFGCTTDELIFGEERESA